MKTLIKFLIALTLTACGTDSQTPNEPNRTAAAVVATVEGSVIVTEGVDLKNGACEFHWKDRMPYDGETVDGHGILTNDAGETYFLDTGKATATVVFKLQGEFLTLKLRCS